MEGTVHSTILASVKTEESVLITQLVNALMNTLELNLTLMNYNHCVCSNCNQTTQRCVNNGKLWGAVCKKSGT